MPAPAHETGLHELSREEYDLLEERANYSRLKHFDRSPAHFRHASEHPDHGDTDARKVGRCLHLAIFEPDVFETDVVTWEGGDRRGREWKAFSVANARREILTVAEAATVTAMARSVRENPDVARYLEAGEAEITALWRDRVTGRDCKARLDWIAGLGALLDLKSARDASPKGFGRQAHGLHYHTQAAFYTDAVHAITGVLLPFLTIAVENTAPFISQLYVVPREAIDAGRRLYRIWLAQLDECTRTGRWPGYSDGPLELQLPRWADRAGEPADLDT